MCSRSRQINSSFHGCLVEIPGIAVDNFEASNLKCRAYFLSHCHSDHTKGLFTSDLLKSLQDADASIFIYMSDLSAAIVEDDCKSDQSLMKFVKPLKLGTTHLTLPSLNKLEEISLQVTLVPAGHCLGSVMFLFHTKMQSILYTGDFNIRSSDLKVFNAFHDDNNEPIKIDALYVDTTFIRDIYGYFPKRCEVIENFIQVVRDWLKTNAANRVSLSLSAKYGYEYVFCEIHKLLGLKVLVDDERWTFYRKIPSLAKCFTNVEEDSPIHICRWKSSNHEFCPINQTKGQNFLYFRFSAMKWQNYKLGEAPVKKVSDMNYNVCFPTHCSRSELISFVSYFSPKKIVGFPNEYDLSKEDERFFNCSSKKRKCNENYKINDRQVEKDVLRNIFLL